MDRFVAMIWDDADPAKQWQVSSCGEALRHASQRWKTVLDAPGFRVFSLIQRGDTPIVTRCDGAEAIIVGPLFERGQEKRGRVQCLDRRTTERMIATRGESLIKNYWGNYVAFWREAESHRTTALRDPCGAVPCFMTQVNDIDMLFSHADDVVRLPNMHFDVDWNYLQAFILFNYFVTRHTGFKQITELLGGERVQWTRRADKQLSWAWNAAEIASTPSRAPFEDAKRELRETAEACFAAWGSQYRNVVVSLSGGLDSSILVNLLRRVSDTKIVGLHYLGVGYEQYEVQLARLAAAKADVELVEAPLDPRKDDVQRILTSPILARPKLQALGVLVDDLSTALADRTRADAFMLGQGGDNLFLQRAAAKHTLADYVKLRGFGKDFWRVAYDAAMLRQHSVWKAVTGSIESLLPNTAWRPYDYIEAEEWTRHRPLAPEAVRAIPTEYKSHPWFAEASNLPRGKADHLVAIVALYNYHVHFWRGIERDIIYPFFSQPIAEFSLRVPTYTLCHSGLDRALERHAFSDLIPEDIARRTGKGGANYYMLQIMKHNINFYRDLILGGEFVQKGWFDRSMLERMTAPDYVAHGGGAAFIYLLVTAEAWLHTCRGNNVRAAA